MVCCGQFSHDEGKLMEGAVGKVTKVPNTTLVIFNRGITFFFRWFGDMEGLGVKVRGLTRVCIVHSSGLNISRDRMDFLSVTVTLVIVVISQLRYSLGWHSIFISYVFTRWS